MFLMHLLFLFSEVMQQKAIEGGALDIMDQYLRQYKKEAGLCNMVLVTIASLTDSGRNMFFYIHK